MILFPPYPEFNGMNDPHVFLNSLGRMEMNRSFDEFLRHKYQDSDQAIDKTAQCSQINTYDVEVFVKDIVEGPQHVFTQGSAYFYHLLREYAVNAWFDRLQAVEDQLENLDCQASMVEQTQDDLSSDFKGLHEERILNEEGLRGALLRYLLPLKSESSQLELDLRAAGERFGQSHEHLSPLRNIREKYAYITCRVEYLLSRTEHRFEMKQSLIHTSLASIQIQESRKSIEQAATVKR